MPQKFDLFVPPYLRFFTKNSRSCQYKFVTVTHKILSIKTGLKNSFKQFFLFLNLAKKKKKN